MGSGGSGKINKPRGAVVKSSARKMSRMKRKAHKRPRGDDDRPQQVLAALDCTTLEKAKQCRSNPKANMKLSGKKRRQLLKEARRLVKSSSAMEVAGGTVKGGPADQEHRGSTMDTA